jgi:hemoglobin-like flavoprotein
LRETVSSHCSTATLPGAPDSTGLVPGGRAFLPDPPLPRLVTSDQIVLVRASWPVIAEHADMLTARFYEHLFAIDDSAARLFTGVDMAAQRQKLVQTLAVVVRALDDLDRLLPAVAALGKRHAHYGVEDRHFDSVGEALLRAISDTLGADFSAEVRAAWAVAYALIASVMRRALVRAAEVSAPGAVA